ncbi:MAG: trigger factor, partial [Pseudomonadales bacterium]|nr:trigger factor [Pseudomonadales bacterium]
MQVTLETTSGLERRMRISVPAAQFEEKVEAKLKQAAGQVRLKGFRPGKVPMREVRRRFGEGIRQEVSSELMQSSFAEAVQQESVAPAGVPSIEDVVIEGGKDLEFTAVFEVFPEVEISDFSTIAVERPVSEVTDADVTKMIETLREQRKVFVDVDRAAQDGDQVVIDFEGFMDGEAFDGGQAEGHTLVLGSGSMIPGFESGIEGMKAGEERDIDVTFPEEYHAENLKGKAVVFKIKVSKVAESQLPELNEEFFTQFGVEEGDLDAFKAEVRQNMDKELAAAIKNRVKTQVLDGLASANKVDVPRALINQEIDRMRREAVQQFGGGNNLDPSILPADMFSAQTEKRVVLGLLVNAVVEQNELKVDDDRVRTMIEDMASSYEDPEQVVNFYYN